MLTGYWPGKLMLDPETIALSLPILTGEPPEGVSYLSSYFRIQKGPVNLSLFFNTLTLLFQSVKQGCACLPCLEYWGAPLKDVMSHGALVLS